MSDSSFITNAGVWLPSVVTLGVLIWGLQLVSATLRTPREDGPQPLIADALTEKNDPKGQMSFSRVAGAIGSVSLAAFMAGLGIWVFFAINGDKDEIKRLSDLWPYMGGGAALFAPYAFNQLSNVFRGPTR